MNLPVKLLSAASAVAILIAADTSSADTMQQFKQINFSEQSQNQQSGQIQTESRTYGQADTNRQTRMQTNESSLLDSAGDEMEDGMENVRAALGTDTTAIVYVNTLASAERLIDQEIYNNAMERVGSVEDLILNGQGEIQQIVVSDGGFLDIGDKEAAFDIQQLNPRYVNNRLHMDLSEQMLDQANHFSTDRADIAPDTDVIQGDHLSASQLLDAELVGPDDETLAEVDNITFGPQGEPSQLIVTYGAFFGFGGDRAALEFSDARLVEDNDGNLRFELTANQTAQFNQMKDRR